MVSQNDVRTAVGIVGNIISLILFLSPSPTFVRICKKRSVEQFSPVPYLATFINCGIWVLYGLPMVHPHSTLVVTINGSGMVIELVFVVLFLCYSSDRRKRLRVFLVMVMELIALGVLAFLVLTLAHTTKVRSAIVGSLAIVGNIMMYASPLSIMRLVISTKSVEFMPFSISLASFANGVCWTIYASLPLDPFILAPNGAGALLGLAQLLLYSAFYKSTKRQMAERQANVEMGLAWTTSTTAASAPGESKDKQCGPECNRSEVQGP